MSNSFFCFSFLFVSGGSGSRYRHFFQLIDNPDIVIIREYKFFLRRGKGFNDPAKQQQRNGTYFEMFDKDGSLFTFISFAH